MATTIGIPPATEAKHSRAETVSHVSPSIDSPPEKRERLMAPHKIAPLAVFLASEGAADISGQIFGVRANEIIVYSQPRPIRSVHTAEGLEVGGLFPRAFPFFIVPVVTLLAFLGTDEDPLDLVDPLFRALAVGLLRHRPVLIDHDPKEEQGDAGCD